MFEDSVMNMRWTGCPWEVVKRLRKYLQCQDFDQKLKLLGFHSWTHLHLQLNVRISDCSSNLKALKLIFRSYQHLELSNLSAMPTCLSMSTLFPDKTRAKWMNSLPLTLISHGSTNSLLIHFWTRLIFCSSWLEYVGKDANIAINKNGLIIAFSWWSTILCALFDHETLNVDNVNN